MRNKGIRIILLAFFSFSAVCSIYSQQVKNQADSSCNYPSNTFYVEFGGNAAQRGISPLNRFSINYERKLYQFRIIKLLVRAGYTIPTKNYYTHIPYDRSEHVIPVMMNFMFGKNRFFLEVGAGEAFVFFNSDHQHVYKAFTSILGIGFSPVEGGVFIRAGLTPTFGKYSSPGSNSPYLGCLAEICLGFTS